MRKEYDVIVVGSGAGGATVARDATRRGKKVLLMERGGNFRWMGNTLSMAFILERFGLIRSEEKYSVVFGDNYGGLSTLAAGCAVPPPENVFGPAGIDLSEEAAEAEKEMWIQELPDYLIGEANLRLMEAANDAGYHWTKMKKFIDTRKCLPNCGGCMLGCRTGAKWSARVYGDEARANGADLSLHTHIESVVVENGKAVGVTGRKLGVPVTYHAKSVVLSAGTGNVDILRRTGIQEAGSSFCCDWLQFVGAIIPGINTVTANPMSLGTMEHFDEDDLVIMPVFPCWSQFAIMLGFMGPKAMLRFPKFWQYSGCMVKIRDQRDGRIYHGTKFSKPITKSDRSKLDKGIDIIKKVFKRAGARMDTVFALAPTGAHPSVSCPIGTVVDSNLETAIKNLYCCDASVFPTSLGNPTVWTSVSLGKRLAKHIANGN